MLAEAHRMLGGKPPEGGRTVTARATVTAQEGTWRLEMSTDVDGVVGERTISGNTCSEVAEAAALVLALAYDPEAVARAQVDPEPAPQPVLPQPPRPPPPPTISPPPPTISPPPPPLLPAPSPPPVISPPAPNPALVDEEPWSFAVTAHVAGDVGALPGPALGIGGGVALRVWRIRMRASASYWLEQKETLPSGAGGEFALFTAHAAGCPLLLLQPIELGGCLGLELGRMRAAGFGVDNPGEDAVLWAAVRPQVEATWLAAPPFGVRASVGAAIPFTRPLWILERVGEVDRPGAVTGRAEFAVELHF